MYHYNLKIKYIYISFMYRAIKDASAKREEILDPLFAKKLLFKIILSALKRKNIPKKNLIFLKSKF